MKGINIALVFWVILSATLIKLGTFGLLKVGTLRRGRQFIVSTKRWILPSSASRCFAAVMYSGRVNYIQFREHKLFVQTDGLMCFDE